MTKVYVKFPLTGLGNMMLVWARAKIFAHLNGLPLITSAWWAFHPGAWLRNEKKKRLYWGYFKESSLLDRIKMRMDLLSGNIIAEPPLEKLNIEHNKDYIFSKVNTGDDLFAGIRNHRGLIRDELYNLLQPAMKAQLQRYVVPEISVHIRRGDFKLGNPITPQSFFIECINEIRKAANENWKVTVFTDADRREVEEVLALPDTILAEAKADILDILLMSKSKAIVLSQSSSFSYWAAFMSEAVILMPPGDWQSGIRKDSTGTYAPEIRWRGTNENRKVLAEAIPLIQAHGN